MNMKRFIPGAILSLLFILNNSALASKLPDDVYKYIKKALPSAQQRFDSVITLPNGIMYIPLYPPTDTEVEEIKTEYTYPENTNLSKLPEVILLNNGYSLLKVSKDIDGNYTLTKKDDLPIKVRLGLMPQDMLTPLGLKMPESLKVTLGDLLIPTKEETSLATNDEAEKKNSVVPQLKRNEFIPTVEFKNKKTLINPKNSKFISVFDNTTQSPLYELKLSSMPLKIITSEKSKAALVLYWSGKIAEIISLEDENIIAQIQLDANATDAVLNEKENAVYVTSQNANAIYVIDFNSMQLKKVIKLDQKPSKITYCPIDNTISFSDEFSSKIYNMTKSSSDYVVQAVGEATNVAKVLSDVANIYAISRTNSELYIYDKVQGKLLNTVTIDLKPTDAVLYGTKLFILCSKEGYLDVYDTVQNKLIQREQLQKDDKTSFYSKITYIPSDKNIMITGINSKNYILYNLETMKLVKKQESYIDVNDIVILDKQEKL